MRTSTSILFAFIFILISACGNQPSTPSLEEAAGSDTVEIPAETYQAIIETASKKAPKPAHDAGNFFAIAADNKIMVGNSADILKNTEISGTDIALSPDGYSIAYTDTTDQRCQVHIYNINTKKDQQLDLGDYSYHARSFSPDGNFLAVNCQFDEFSCMVILYDLRDSSLSNVVNPDSQSLYNPTFSPDGTLLVCHDMRKAFVYSFSNGITKHIKSISCDNLCVDNDLSINTTCQLQLTPTHDKIVYTCADYGTERENFLHLNIYDLKTGKIKKILSDKQSCKDFEVSDDGNIYFLMESDSVQSVACLANLSDLNPVTISNQKFSNATALRVAY
ncbi:MAG: hypothetical protein K6F33_08000 [Bacteroidales bacterium]|nr:hypothetical protein [Bacteroidales bacterium]